MKLLGCHIDNFGAFRNFDLTFNDGLNVIMQANGWGKTTLSAFVKAMLYGFEGKRVRNVAENERLRYRPWQGGKYGGSLDFEARGREYRVIRTFGATAAKDDCKVVDIETGKSAASETGENVGEWLFGLDANAFQKSVFVVQNGFGFDGSTAGLRNRLNSLVNEADDVAGFDKAQAKLEERRKYYKKTGNRGAIAEISKDVAKLVDAEARADAKVAELRGIGVEIASYDSSISTLDARIAETQAAEEKDLAAIQQEQALLKVGAQLRNRQQETKTALEAATAAGTGKVPTVDNIGSAKRDIAELARIEREAAEAGEAAKRAAENRQEIEAKYPGGLPGKQELQDVRSRIADLMAREKAFAAAQPAEDAEHARLRNVVASDPGLIERAETAVERLGDVNAALAAGKAASDELRTARAQWGEKRKRISGIAKEAAESTQAAPADARAQAEALRRDARELRAAASEIVKMDAQCETLENQLAEEKAELDALSGGRTYEASDLDSLERASRAAGEVTQAVNAARAVRDAKASSLSETKRAAKAAREKVETQRAKAAQTKPGSPAPAIACFVIAVAAIAAGVALGPMSPTSLVLYVIGLALAIVGGVLLFRRKPAAQAEPDAADLRMASEAESAYERSKAEADRAESDLADAESSAHKATVELAAIVNGLFPGESFDNSTLVAQVPVLKERLSARSGHEAKVAAAQERLDAAVEQRDAALKRIAAMSERHDGIAGGSAEDRASAMEARATELTELAREASTAKRKIAAAIAEEMGVEASSIDSTTMETFISALGQEEPPGAVELAAKEKAAEDTAKAYASELSGLLESFGLESVGVAEIAVGAERIAKAIAGYRAEDARMMAAQKRSNEEAASLGSARAEIAAWAKTAGVASIDGLTDDWFSAVDADVAIREKATWEEQRARERADSARRRSAELRANLGSFFSGFGIEKPENMTAEIDALEKRADAVSELQKAAELADAELTRWMNENRTALESASARVKSQQTRDGSPRALDALRQQRDMFVKEKAQREEQRNALLESLENRLAVQQELELLSKKKQAATANLFTIQKTAEYLQKAREGLDGRYLGGLADRFGDYANAWLEGEEVEATIDSDFGVAIYDGDAARDVAGYSTGYQDLLDICLRMALVDTVFQAEPPFLIMDDPFTSLDEDKIRRAFLLLEALASKYQVIYFTCHPSRMEAADAETGKAAFVLPEQHARRELPRARAKREAEERARAQAELVASYAVVPVTGGRASIAPAGKRRTINSNLLNVEFVVDESTGTRDNSFEVHFIDEKGRVLCDRQTIEVIGGRTVPEKVRFSLATRDDSGSTYDMIIHEDERGPAELAARIPYKAEVSFATDDFGL